MARSWHGPAFGLSAAVLFGATGPFAKLLLQRGLPELELAALLYAGAALGLSALSALRPAVSTPFTRTERWCLAVAILMGGLFAPILQMVGFARQTGLVASLLLNLEAPGTVLLAVLFFGEMATARMLAGGALTIAGSVLLTLSGSFGDPTASVLGALSIAGACMAWAVDNNVTARVSQHDPLRIATIKCLAATPLLLGLAAMRHGRMVWQGSSAGPLVSALALGFVGYGLSLVCYIRALRSMGAARMGAMWACAPFVGAWVAIPVLGDEPTPFIASAGLLIALGVVLIVKDTTAQSAT